MQLSLNSDQASSKYATKRKCFLFNKSFECRLVVHQVIVGFPPDQYCQLGVVKLLLFVYYISGRVKFEVRFDSVSHLDGVCFFLVRSLGTSLSS